MIRLRTVSILALILALGTAAASSLPAQDEVVLKTGVVLKGKVVDDDGAKVTVRLSTDGGGSATAVYPYEDLGAPTLYRVRLARTPRDDARKQLDLAIWAFDQGLLDSARLSYLLAWEADAKQGGAIKEDLQAALKRAAPTAMKLARDDLAAGRVLKAEQRLARILQYLPECTEAEQARALLDETAAKAMEAREQERLAKVSPEAREKTAKQAVAPAKVHYDKAHGLVRQGLKDTEHQSQSIGSFRSALAEFDAARKQLAETLKSEGPQSEFAAHYETWDKMVVGDIVATRLHIASVYFVRGSYKNALEEVNAGLALDAGNAEALGMRGRIEVASSEGGRWRW